MAEQHANRDGPPTVDNCDDAVPPTWVSIGVVVAMAAMLVAGGQYASSFLRPAQPHGAPLPDINSITGGQYASSQPHGTPLPDIDSITGGQYASSQPHGTPLPDINSITYEVCGMYESFAQMSGSPRAEVTLYTILGVPPPCLSGGKEDVAYSSLVLGAKSVYGVAVASASRAICLAGDPCHTTTEGGRRPGLIGGGGDGSRLERDRVGLVARATKIILDKQKWKMYSAVFGGADCDDSGRREDEVARICGKYWNS